MMAVHLERPGSALAWAISLCFCAITVACPVRPSDDRGRQGGSASPDTVPLIGNVPESEQFGADSVRWAEFRLRTLETNILRFHDANRQFPESLAQAVPIPPGLPTKRSYRYDPWGTVVWYSRTDSTFELRSAGPDRLYRTGDDVLLAFSFHDRRNRGT